MSPRTSASGNTQKGKINWMGQQQSFRFTGICSCGGRVAYRLIGKAPNRTSVATCKSCGRAEVAQEGV